MMPNTNTAIVLGGAGDVGEGVVRQLRQAGWDVLVPSRSREKLDHVAGSTDGPGGFIPILGDVGSAEGASNIAAEVRSHGNARLVVASLGGWWSGPPLLEMEAEDLDGVIAGGLISHFHAARAFIPLLMSVPGSQYVFINGGAARMPVPGSAPISIVASAQEMMQRAFASEIPEDRPHIYTLLLSVLIETRSRKVAPEGSISADDVGAAVIERFEDRPANGATVEIP